MSTSIQTPGEWDLGKYPVTGGAQGLSKIPEEARLRLSWFFFPSLVVTCEAALRVQVCSVSVDSTA